MSAGGSHAAVGTGAGASLHPLTPSYEDAEHGMYLKHLRKALTGDRGLVHNIALTGGYGVGKSSILQELSKEFEKRALTLSLPTLGETGTAAGADGKDSPAVSVTNRIQKEIVKQLLYRERPERVPGFGYRRPTRFKWLRATASSLMIAAPVVVVLYLTHFADRLVHLAGHGLLPHGLAYLALTVFLSVIITAILHTSHNRFRIQQLGAGPASVTLADNSDSYFDKYLDEIIYFFEATKYEILVFEDIDRFDDPHIFETLRELNTILNSSNQLGGRSIRFIYAIKDSIFEQLGRGHADQPGAMDAAEAEVARANRTKFFDLVIPVVPFITHRSARDLMSDLMEGSGLPVSRQLIDLTARHVADMRLIKNIHNEFVVFREKLLLGGNVPDLGEDQLFAMILYKNVHLSDFELIRTGKSRLDDLYRDSRLLVSVNMRTLNERARDQSRIIADPDPLQSRSALLGERLKTYIDRVVHRHRQQHRGSPITMQMQNRPVSEADLVTVAFWRTFLTPGSELRVTLRNYQNDPFIFTSQSIGDALGEALTTDEWKERDLEAARTELASVREDQALLGHADMNDLFARPDFTLAVGGAELSFAEIAEQALDSQLAVDLVANGYIDRNFTLYVSQFHGVHVGSQAMNFILHNVQPNIMDPYFRFDSPADIEAVLHECGTAMLGDRSSYNIAVLDHLLEHHSLDADTVIRELAAWGADEQEFVQAYTANGKQAERLVRRLSAFWPRTLQYVVTDLEIDDGQRAVLVNAAMLGADPAKLPTPEEQVAQYIERNYQRLAALTDETEAPTAEHIVRLLEQLDVRLDSIEPLSAEVRKGVIEGCLYVLSRQNLVQAIDGSVDLSLDHIQAANEYVYAYVLENLQDYVSIVLREHAPRTISSPERFAAILEDVAEHDQSAVSVIIEHASPDCRVSDISKINEVAWPGLARTQRFPMTLANLSTYVDKIGVDESLAVPLLANPKLPDLAAFDDQLGKLPYAILNAGSVLTDPSVRVQIVGSFGLASYLAVDAISWEKGRMAGLLVAEDLVEDNGSVYDAIASADWTTKEFLISKSENFAQYVTPQQLPAADVRHLLESRLIGDALKKSLLSRLRTFATADDSQTLQAAADYAVRVQTDIDVDALQLFAEAKVKGATIVQLLQPVLKKVPLSTLTAIFNGMSEPYKLLGSPGSRPARLPNDPAHRALASYLKESEIVSSVTSERDGKTIRVNMKRPSKEVPFADPV